MMSDPNLVWLASYPKSGNTWVRIFLSALIAGENFDLNRLHINRIFHDRAVFDCHLEDDTRLLYQSELDFYYPKVWRLEAVNQSQLIIKTHDTCRRNTAGELIFPVDATQSAIYIVRNPLDVCISLAHFVNITIDQAIDFMNDSQARTLKEMFFLTNTVLDSVISSWQENVRSWTAIKAFPVLVIRYEDLIDDVRAQFSRLIEFLNLSSTHDFDQALNIISFDNLASLERTYGFERPLVSKAFFRAGKKDQWKNVLTREQIARVINNNQTVMQQFGYL